MERRDARLFQHDANSQEGWNIVELESHRQLRQRINELLVLTNTTLITTNEVRQRLHALMHLYGSRFATQLVRSLQRNDEDERQTIVWLLTVLNDKRTIPLLQNISLNKRLPRPIRLSASLALAGMGATKEAMEEYERERHVKYGRLYAIS